MPSPRFTPESARIAGQQGNASQAAARLRHAENIRALHNGADFQAESLARLREILTTTFERLRAAKDPKDIELLSRALAHQAETERKLAGRPLPGTRRNDGPAPAPPRQTLPEPR